MSESVSALGGASYDGFVAVREIGPLGMISLRVKPGVPGVEAAIRGVTGTGVPAQRRIEVSGERAVAWMTRNITRQHELQLRLKRLGETDQLTGLYNRHFFFDQYHQRVQGQPLTGLIMLDLDHFKQINDRYGHQTGDRVLCRVCDCVSAQLRGEDLFVRSGGEEFLILLPQIDEGILLKVAERIRAAVAAMEPDPAPVTVSLGTTLIRPGEDLGAVLARADEWLYRAKRGGRNQVAHDGDP